MKTDKTDLVIVGINLNVLKDLIISDDINDIVLFCLIDKAIIYTEDNDKLYRLFPLYNCYNCNIQKYILDNIGVSFFLKFDFLRNIINEGKMSIIKVRDCMNFEYNEDEDEYLSKLYAMAR